MGALGEMAAAAVFTTRDHADEAWGLLMEAGIPSSVVTDPGIMGAYRVSVMVDRDNLEAAQTELAGFMKELGSDQ
ncbi:MAG: hypothetical protein ACR2N2_04400 [Acidimicrobiia bacterium]